MTNTPKLFKILDKILSPFGKVKSAFFGSDERIFVTGLTATVILFFTGFTDAAIIVSVYDAMFGYAGMQKYAESGSTSSEPDEMDEIMDMTQEAMQALDQVQEGEEENA